VRAGTHYIVFPSGDYFPLNEFDLDDYQGDAVLIFVPHAVLDTETFIELSVPHLMFRPSHTNLLEVLS